MPGIPSIDDQSGELQPFARFLELEGWTVRPMSFTGTTVAPLLVKHPDSGREIAVGTYPSLLSRQCSKMLMFSQRSKTALFSLYHTVNRT